MARFVLLDRDGVINRKIRNGYVIAWSQFAFLPGALDAMRMFRDAGYVPLVVSNQAGVGKGLMTHSTLNEITRRFSRRIEAAGGRIGKVYYCVHRREQRCACRKPRAGLLFAAQRDFHFDLAETYMVGDSKSDLIAAARAGCAAVIVSGNAASQLNEWVVPPNAVAPDLRAAAEFILSHPLGSRRVRQIPEVAPGLLH